MPMLAPIAAVIAAGAGAAGAGLSIDEAVNQPKAPKPAPGVTPQTSQAIKAAVSQAAPDIVSQTGGSVSPAYTLLLSQLQAGTANTPGGGGSAQDAINNLFGLGGGGGPTTTGVGTPGSGVSDFKPASLPSGSGGMVDEGLSSLFQNLNLAG